MAVCHYLSGDIWWEGYPKIVTNGDMSSIGKWGDQLKTTKRDLEIL